MFVCGEMIEALPESQTRLIGLLAALMDGIERIDAEALPAANVALWRGLEDTMIQYIHENAMAPDR